ncbi:hydrolase [Klebsiella pneumoniae]|uniref:Hydrolase n=1 Tax=Klebsiella pneumoniae TaxID=573 RepID=A0A2X3D079_KLEPN|nr:hydrolase [Klebsiella pneumoniae]
MEAQRFPQDFDGISAGAPAAFFQFQNSFFHGWNVAANQRPDGTAILLKNRLPLIHQARAGSLPDAFRRAGWYPAKSVCLSVL